MVEKEDILAPIDKAEEEVVALRLVHHYVAQRECFPIRQELLDSDVLSTVVKPKSKQQQRVADRTAE